LEHVDLLSNKLNVDTGLGRIIHTYNFGTDTKFYGYAGTFHSSLIELIEKLPIVEFVSKDEIVSLSTQSGSSLTQTPAPWGLSRIWRRKKPASYDQFTSTYVYNSARGAGVDAYVLDTGIKCGT
jgi:hypothetical protein